MKSNFKLVNKTNFEKKKKKKTRTAIEIALLDENSLTSLSAERNRKIPGYRHMTARRGIDFLTGCR